MVAFFKSPTGERFIILEIFILLTMTMLIYVLYQKELKKRDEIHKAMDIIRTFVVGTNPFYVDKDDLQILAAAQNISEEMRYFANINEALQKEIDTILENLNDGWVNYQNTLYWFSAELSSWVDSQKNCERQRAKLISMETSEEQKFMNKEVRSRKRIFWIGLFKDKNKKWSYLSGMEAAVHYWKTLEPNRKAKHDCAAMTFDCSGENCWMALECDFQINYICKKGPDDAWL